MGTPLQREKRKRERKLHYKRFSGYVPKCLVRLFQRTLINHLGGILVKFCAVYCARLPQLKCNATSDNFFKCLER